MDSSSLDYIFTAFVLSELLSLCPMARDRLHPCKALPAVPNMETKTVTHSSSEAAAGMLVPMGHVRSRLGLVAAAPEESAC